MFFSLGKSHALNGRCDSTPRILTLVQPTKWNLEKFEYLLMFVYMFKDFFEIENYSYLRNANENQSQSHSCSFQDFFVKVVRFVVEFTIDIPYFLI